MIKNFKFVSREDTEGKVTTQVIGCCRLCNIELTNGENSFADTENEHKICMLCTAHLSEAYTTNFKRSKSEESSIKRMTVVCTWFDLQGHTSDTHYLEINVLKKSGYIVSKTDAEERIYLATHSFYEKNLERTTALLQEKGFSVVLSSYPYVQSFELGESK